MSLVTPQNCTSSFLIIQFVLYPMESQSPLPLPTFLFHELTFLLCGKTSLSSPPSPQRWPVVNTLGHCIDKYVCILPSHETTVPTKASANPVASPVHHLTSLGSVIAWKLSLEKGQGHGKMAPCSAGLGALLTGGLSWAPSTANDSEMGECKPRACWEDLGGFWGWRGVGGMYRQASDTEPGRCQLSAGT